MKISILKREFYKKSGTELAKDLLGKILVHKLDGKYMRGRIVETARVGIDYAEEYRETPWRFYIRGNKFISKK